MLMVPTDVIKRTKIKQSLRNACAAANAALSLPVLPSKSNRHLHCLHPNRLASNMGWKHFLSCFTFCLISRTSFLRCVHYLIIQTTSLKFNVSERRKASQRKKEKILPTTHHYIFNLPFVISILNQSVFVLTAMVKSPEVGLEWKTRELHGLSKHTGAAALFLRESLRKALSPAPTTFL